METKREAVDSGERGEYETRPASPRLLPNRNEVSPSNLAQTGIGTNTAAITWAAGALWAVLLLGPVLAWFALVCWVGA